MRPSLWRGRTPCSAREGEPDIRDRVVDALSPLLCARRRAACGSLWWGAAPLFSVLGSPFGPWGRGAAAMGGGGRLGSGIRRTGAC
jgi:hypothetical protein